MRRHMHKMFVLALLAALFMLTTSAAAAGPAPSGPIVHVVAPGETLSGIAMRYGTTVAAIAAANNIPNPNWIYVGQRLVIPGYPAPPPANYVRYTVQPGDTLTAIAIRFGTTVQAIVQANNIWNPSYIQAGVTLLIPVAAPPPPVPPPPPPPAAGFWYMVQPGDTVSGIALRYGTTVWAIVYANSLPNPSLIFPGQKLWIPAPVPPPPPTPTPTPTPTPVLEPAVCNPNTSITYPRVNEVLDGLGTIFILGTADIPDFQFYKLEYGVGEAPHEFHSIDEPHTKRIVNGILETWNTGALPNGVYILRLTVVDDRGQFPPPCDARVIIQH